MGCTMTFIPKTPHNQLSDGRTVRALEGTFKQEQMFGLHKSGRFNPAHEAIMGVKEHDDSLNTSGAWQKINVNNWWKTGRYAAYRRGFENDLDLQIGDRLVFIEKGTAHILEIPDVRHPTDKDKSLRQAAGMLDFDLQKLRYDPEARIVSVTTDFNPDSDVRVVDIMRPEGWALPDKNGYPIRTQQSGAGVPKARFAVTRPSGAFEGESTGYHASVILSVVYYNGTRYIYAVHSWSDDSTVAVVTPAQRVSGLIVLPGFKDEAPEKKMENGPRGI